MVGALDYFGNELIIDLGEYEKEFTNAYSIQYDMDRNFVMCTNKILYKLSKYGMDLQKNLGIKE
jgi:hypothetical protein